MSASRTTSNRTSAISVGPSNVRRGGTKRTIREVSGRAKIEQPRKYTRRNRIKDEGLPLPDSELKTNLSSSSEEESEESMTKSSQKEEKDFETYVVAECNCVRLTNNSRKFKVIVKEGIAQMKGREYLFTNSSAEFEW